MAVKILIHRTVAEALKPELLPLLKQLRTLTTNQPGYISGETLRRIDRTGETLVISTWQSVNDWRRWARSDERHRVQEKIDQLLGEQTSYSIYEYE